MQFIFLIFFFTIFVNPISLFGTGRTGRTRRETNTENPSLFKQNKDPVTEEMPDSDAHDAYHHLEKHIHSLKKLSRSNKDQRIEISEVNNLFACLEFDSPYSDCSKIESFK